MLETYAKHTGGLATWRYTVCVMIIRMMPSIYSGMRLIELENTELKEVRDKLEKVISEIKHKKHLLGEMEMATTNFFHLLQKYKIDVVRIHLSCMSTKG